MKYNPAPKAYRNSYKSKKRDLFAWFRKNNYSWQGNRKTGVGGWVYRK